MVGHVVSALNVHLVFVTKYRRDAINTDMPRRCQDATRKVSDRDRSSPAV